MFDKPLSTVKWFELRKGSGPLLHLAVAVIIAAACIWYFGVNANVLMILAVVNAVGWPVREAYQHYPHVDEIIHHPQSFTEWAVPILLSIPLAIWSQMIWIL